ncbi:UNVERIFIED_CONTAM: Serine carboxypeptidase II-3 [Sesamum radiatum]|uniref:Serine carboxypeptidase II-3 n=1 Tax=Sesamum radiatum TaxID=300843 RepID=A0AAW2MVK2_SESRA
MYDYYWTHALISDEHHKAILSNCNFSSSASVSAVCNSVLDQADAALGTVYYYDIYAPYAIHRQILLRNTIFLNLDDRPDTILPTIKELMAGGVRVWIYSGDTDKRVPVTSTRYSLEKLGTPVKTPWYPWYNQGEVGGYAVEYQNVTFVSIRGAGHFVPSYQPQRALAVFSSFLDGKLPPRRN